MRPNVLIFANPISGRGQGQVVARQLESDLQTNGFDVSLFLDRPGATDSATLPDAQAAICIGGDGTLRAVIELYAAIHRPSPPLLPIPMGTANLMGRHFGVRWDRPQITEGVLATLRRGKIVRLDVGRANQHWFMLMAGVGIDAQVVHLLDQARRGPISYASYVVPTALTLLGYRFPPLYVRVDGSTIFDHQPGIAFVGNVKEYGTGFPILVDARPDDGLLDICVLPCKDWRDLAHLLLSVGTGDHPLREEVIYTTGRRVTIESATPIPVQLDGDGAGFTPLNINVLPCGVPFLLPVATGSGR